MIELYGVAVTKDGPKVDGRLVSWLELERILGALPQLARNRLKWFPSDGPPSSCIQAIDEIKDISKALLEEEEP